MNITIDRTVQKSSLKNVNLRKEKKQNVENAHKQEVQEKINPELIKAYNVSFGHKLPKHLNCGISFNYNTAEKPISGNANLFTFKDVEKAELQVVRAIDNVKDVLLANFKNIIPKEKLTTIPLLKKGENTFERTNISTEKLSPKDRYRFKLTFKDGKEEFISDLNAKEFTDPFDKKSKLSPQARAEMKKNSLIQWPIAYDSKAYKPSQSHKDWVNGLNPKRITTENSNSLNTIQVHIGTFSKEGNFDGLIKKLDKIKKQNFNSIEIMPHGFFHDKNWGYDPSFPLASKYGGMDEFKRFVDEAHKKEMNVIIDVVNNHYSMDNPEILKKAGPFEHPDPNMGLEFGPRLNYTQEGKEGVRDWRINEVLQYADMGVDGIRFDLTEFTGSDGFLTELSHEVNHHYPNVVLIAEDARGKITNPLPSEIKGITNPDEHQKIKQKLQNDEYGYENIGFNHRWHFGWAHAIEHTALNPYDRQLENLKNQTWNAQHQTKALFTHDEIGKQEADGNDFVVKEIISKLFGADAGNLGWGTPRGKQENYWKLSRTTRKLTNIYETGEKWPSKEKQLAKEITLSGDDPNDFNGKKYGFSDYEKGGFGLERYISKEEFKNVYDESKKTNKAMMGFLYGQPGPKMVFQSYNEPSKRFAFQRKQTDHFYETFNRHESLAKGVDWEAPRKGHRLDCDEIINEAQMDTPMAYTKEAVKYQSEMQELVSQLNKISQANPAIQGGEIQNVITHEGSSLIAVHSKKDNNEIFAITNFGEANNYDKNYGIDFPKGKWEEIINTNDKKFGGDGKCLNKNKINASEKHAQTISIPKASTVIFKKISD